MRFSTHFDHSDDAGYLPPQLRKQYGADLTFPDPPAGRPYVYTNFVTTLDGVAAFGGAHGRSEGRLVSMKSTDDQWLLGLLRATADCVMAGAGTLRAEPGHTWTTSALPVAPAAECLEWRNSLGLPDNPLQCFVTGSGHLDLGQTVFQREDLEVVIITTDEGAAKLGTMPRSGIHVVVAGAGDSVDLGQALTTLLAQYGVRRLLCEGGPNLFGQLLALDLLDECFQTIAPQMAGADSGPERLSLTGGASWAPGATPRFSLLSLRTGATDRHHLFLRLRRTDSR